MPVGLPAYEVLLVYGRNKRVGGVYHVAHVEPSRLRQELIGIQPREPVLVFEPADEFCVGYTGCILHRPRATDNHEPIFGFDAGPLYTPALDNLKRDCHPARYLQRYATKLPLALASVAVPSVEKCSLVPHGQVDFVSRS